MSRKNIFVFALLFAFLCPELAFAQRGGRVGGYRGASQSDDVRPRKEKKVKKTKKSKRKKKRQEEEEEEEEERAPEIVVGSDKESIEAYLQQRLAKAKKSHKNQDKWGRGMTGAWAKFWSQMYDDRKSFEIRIARQRLNLFESLDSLEVAFHGQTISDFERLQSNIIKSFEAQQAQKMKDYFAVLFTDLKSFQDEQEAGRLQMGQEAMDAWRAQKAASRAGK